MKRKKFLVACIMAVLCMATATPTYASNHEFVYHFFGFVGERQPNGEEGVPSKVGYAKSDNEQAYYLTLDKKDKNTGKKNNLSKSNVFGCRMHRQDEKKKVDSYHTFTKYVQKRKISYTAKVSKNTKMYLCGQKDDSSTSNKMLYVSGRYAP
ncbi:MAG: hypothetical protein ACI4HI_17840 [Lachnospiraceae bacterium]